ncbi:hypothetical protein AX15_006409 [Amanita polypyramis BW_CC]|nr:hypothetical protein AX15_006409 [Amanita polypyramis BW_CC]
MCSTYFNHYAGSTTTIESTKTTIVPVTSQVVNTFYSTSCTGTTPNPTTTTSSVYSPIASTVTSLSSSTGSDGSVVVTQVTQTLTLTPSLTETTPGPTADQHNNNNRIASSNLAPIIGGSVGGFVGLVGIVFLVWFLLKRRTNWDDIFEKEDAILGTAFPKPKRDPPPDPKPKPYEYGLVGQTTAAPHMSPPSSSAGLSLSSEGANTYSPPPNLMLPQQQQLGPGPALNQQTLIHQLGPGQNQPTLLSFSSNGHSSTAVMPGPSNFGPGQDSVSGAWVSPGVGRYPPGMQRSLTMRANPQTQAGSGVAAGQRTSIFDENEVYGGIVADTPAAGPSGATNHGHSNSFGLGSSARPDSAASEYREAQSATERRDGKGRLITTSEKPPIVHLDGDRYRAPGSSSFGDGPVLAPPAYTA